LWLGTISSGVFRVVFQGASAHQRGKASVQHYGVSQGLPLSHGSIHVYRFGTTPLFATGRGLYRFNAATQRFEPEPMFGERFANGSTRIHALASDGERHVWLKVSEDTH